MYRGRAGSIIEMKVKRVGIMLLPSRAINFNFIRSNTLLLQYLRQLCFDLMTLVLTVIVLRFLYKSNP